MHLSAWEAATLEEKKESFKNQLTNKKLLNACFVGFQVQLFYWIKKNSHGKWGSIFWSHLKLEVDVPAGGTIGGSTSGAGARGQRVPSVRVCNLEFLRSRHVFILVVCFVYICLSTMPLSRAAYMWIATGQLSDKRRRWPLIHRRTRESCTTSPLERVKD